MIQSPYNIIHVFHIMCFKDKTHKIGYLNNQIDQAQVNTIAYIGLVENIISDNSIFVQIHNFNNLETYHLNNLKLGRYHKYKLLLFAAVSC